MITKEQNKELQTFQHDVFGSIRVVEKDGQPWFVRNDVCKCLDLENPSKVSMNLKESQKGVTKGYTLGGIQEIAIISESGLYSIIFKSRKAEAIEFQNWVCEAVLPSIRKYGGYIHTESPSLQTAIDNIEYRIRRLEEKELPQVENHVEKQFEVYTEMRFSELRAFIRDHYSNLTMWEALRILRDSGLLYQDYRSKHWPTKDSIRRHLFRVRSEKRDLPCGVQTYYKVVFVTQKGLELVCAILDKEEGV
jgi:prophage antirepressor-like protein